MQRKRKARYPDPNSPDLMTLLKLVENELRHLNLNFMEAPQLILLGVRALAEQSRKSANVVENEA